MGYEAAAVVEMSNAKLCYLATAAGDRVLMAVRARAGVIERAQSFVDAVGLFEDSLCRAERGIVDHAVAFALAARII